MTEEQNKLKYIDLTYIGSDFVKKGVNVKGEEYESFIYKFKLSPDDQYDRKFYGFGRTKGASELKPGEVFRIGYQEFTNSHGTISRSAKFFGKPDPNRPINNDTTPTQPTPQPTPVSSSVPDWVALLEEFKTSRKPEEQKAGTFATFVMFKLHKDTYDEAQRVYGQQQ